MKLNGLTTGLLSPLGFTGLKTGAHRMIGMIWNMFLGFSEFSQARFGKYAKVVFLEFVNMVLELLQKESCRNIEEFCARIGRGSKAKQI